MTSIFPVYKYIKAVSGDYIHENSSQTFLNDDLHLVDELELYRLCDQPMNEQLTSGTLQYYESVSGTDDGINIEYFPSAIEAFDRLCENAFGTPFRGDPVRSISGYKQFYEDDTQRAIEESFPAIFETVSGVPMLREQITRNIEFDSPIVSVTPVPGERRAIITVDPSQSGLGKDASFQFFNNGANIKDKWLDHEGSNINCLATPGVVPNNSKLRFITFSNTRDGSDIDLLIYKNGTDPADLFHKWEIRDARRGFDSTLLAENLLFAAGDTIRVFMADPGPGLGPSPNKAVIKISMINTDDSATSGFIEFDEDE